MKTYSYFLLIIVVPLFLTACDSFTSVPKGCTLIFETIRAKVLNPEGEPADSVEITISFGDEAETVDPCTEVYGEYCDQEGDNGRYIIFHDGYMDKLDEGEWATVLVEGVKGQTSFSQKFVFTHDGCHVKKVAGPDTITLKAN